MALWETLLAPQAPVVAPWVGGTQVHTLTRSWACVPPRQWGWYSWTVHANKLRSIEQIQAPLWSFARTHRALLVGDQAWSSAHPYGQVHVPLPPEGLPPFSVVSLGKLGGSYFVETVLFETEAEEAVRLAVANERENLEGIPDVTPAHRAAFDVLRQLRLQRAQLAAERERLRKLEEARKAGGTPEGRRELAKVDFAAGCRAALAVSNALYSSHRIQGRNIVVDWVLDGRPFQCVVDANLRIMEAGICLSDHATGVSWDTTLTLESLPAVVREAQRLAKLVVFRHAAGDPWDDDE